jgi:hypothetical protein
MNVLKYLAVVLFGFTAYLWADVLGESGAMREGA